MANNENLIPIPGRLHSVATEGHVSGADEIYDDTQQKDQETINSELIQAVGTGGSVDSKIAASKAEIIGDAATDYNTLGKLEDKIQAEASRAGGAEGALDGRVDTLEEAVGTGGSVDSRISAAVATETTRAQAAEADRYTKSETYSKTELNNLITTPNQEYVSVTATAQTTAVTDVLPATGAADTTYRVGNWDGTQYNDSVFSEYGWNGSAYIKLSTKSQVGEVYDISVNHADTKYADLAAALGTNGANIPQSLRKGGMSVKFVLSSDNKYVQYRLMSDTFNTTVANWQGVDDELIPGSNNLAKSGVLFNIVGGTAVINLRFSSGEHSSGRDRIFFNAKQGEQYKVEISSEQLSGGQIWEYYTDGSGASKGNIGVDSEKTYTASKDLLGIGLYFLASTSGAVDITVTYLGLLEKVKFSSGEKLIDTSIAESISENENGLTRGRDVYDIKKYADQIKDYFEQISLSRNLIDNDIHTAGRIDSDGRVVASADAYVTGYIPCHGESNVSWSYNNSSAYVAFYDFDKKYIESSSVVCSEKTATIPVNAYYLRLTYSVYSTKNIAIWGVTTELSANDFVPYNKGRSLLPELIIEKWNAISDVIGSEKLAECNTAGDVAAKGVSLGGYTLTSGPILVKMVNQNTAADATININSTGAKPLYYNGVRASDTNSWGAGEILEVRYDGVNMQATDFTGCLAKIIGDIRRVNTCGHYNIIDRTNLITGVIRLSDGAHVYNGDYKHTDYIPCHNEKYISWSYGIGSNGIAFYDENLQFISSVAQAEKKAVIPDNAYYVRLTCSAWESTKSMATFEYRDDLVGDAKYDLIPKGALYRKIYDNEDNIAFIQFFLDTLNKVPLTRNILDGTRYVGYINVNGTVSSGDFRYTPYYYCHGEYNISWSYTNQSYDTLYVAFYDKDKKFISSVSVNEKTATVPEGAWYVRFTVSAYNFRHIAIFGIDTTLTTDNYLEYSSGKELLHHIEYEKWNDFCDIVNERVIGDNSISFNNEDKLPVLKIQKSKCRAYPNNSSDAYVSLLFTTDIHTLWSAFTKALAFGENESNIDGHVCLGDIGELASDLNNYNWKSKILSLSKPMLVVPGNHDVWQSVGSTADFTGFTDDALYEKLYDADLVAHNGEIHPTGKLYWYKDISKTWNGTTKTLRVIGLYQYEYQTPYVEGVPQNNNKTHIYYSQSQINWLIDLLDNTDSNTYVVILSHAVLTDTFEKVENAFTPKVGMQHTSVNSYQSNPNMVVDILDAWIKGESVDITNTMTDDGSVVTVYHTFNSTHENQFFGFISGHFHSDWILNLGGKDIKQIVLNCTTAEEIQQNSDLPRHSGKFSDCITSVTFDWDTHTMRLIRWGADVTMYGQERKYDYVDCTIE